jgi:hypothetical protein
MADIAAIRAISLRRKRFARMFASPDVASPMRRVRVDVDRPGGLPAANSGIIRARHSSLRLPT